MTETAIRSQTNSGTGHQRKLRVACTSVVHSALNPYLRLLYFGDSQVQAASSAIDVVEAPGVSINWLWRNRRQVDVLHLHWPSFLYTHPQWLKRWLRLLRMTIGLLVARMAGIKVVWTAHNVMPHESLGWIDIVGRRIVIRLSHLILANHEPCLADLRKRFRVPTPAVVIPHMTYDGVYSGCDSRADARSELGLNPKDLVVVHFGAVRANKNLDQVVTAFSNASAPSQILLIAGNCPPGIGEEIAKASQNNRRIIGHFRDISDSEVATYLRAADIAVMASDTTTSGTLFLYLTFELPVILPEGMAREFGPDADWLMTYRPDDDGEALAGCFRDLEPSELAGKANAAHRVHVTRSPNHVHKLFVEQMQQLCKCRIRSLAN